MALSYFCRSEKLTGVAYTGAPPSHIYAVNSNRFHLIGIVVVLHHITLCVQLSFIYQPSKSHDVPILHHYSFYPLGKEKCKTLITVEVWKGIRRI